MRHLDSAPKLHVIVGDAECASRGLHDERKCEIDQLGDRAPTHCGMLSKRKAATANFLICGLFQRNGGLADLFNNR